MPANKSTAARDDAFVITRVFHAPRDLVWKTWSEADEMQSWWGPKGCTIELRTFDFRPGGFFHYAMRFPDRSRMWGRFLYCDIAPQERIAWLNSFSNEGCGITRAPFDALIPLEILNEVTLIEKAGKTTVTLRASPHGAEANEVGFFQGMFASLNEGYGGTLDKLAARLAAKRAA